MYYILLFFLLSILYALEASTNIARKSGYNINNASSGLFFQSALGILSRLVMFVFMPLLGFLADTSKLEINYFLLFYLLVPFSILILHTKSRSIEYFYGKIILRLSERGSYFKRSKSVYKSKPLFKKEILSLKFKISFILIGIPFYVSWPLIILALILFEDYRATIIGMSALFNGFYTLYLSVLVDPLLSKLGNYKNIIAIVYDEIVFLKLISSTISVVLFFLITLIISFY
jgi:hypothetical protein